MQQKRIHVRSRMTESDLPEILEIERETFQGGWDQKEFLAYKKCVRDCKCMVADYGSKVAGFMICQICDGYLFIPNFAVHPNFRRRRVGSHLVREAKEIQPRKLKRIKVLVSEENKIAQRFLESHDFHIVKTIMKISEPNVLVMEFWTDSIGPAVAGRLLDYFD